MFKKIGRRLHGWSGQCTTEDMSKTKLGWLVFFLAFGVNLFAFLFFKKNGQIEENKTIWLYELPKTAAPLDAYVTADYGPAQALTGTLMIPADSSSHPSSRPPMPGLAASVQVSGGDTQFRFTLDSSLTFTDGSPITAQVLMDSMQWSQMILRPYSSSMTPLWQNFIEAKIEAISERELLIKFPTEGKTDSKTNRKKSVSAEQYLSQLFTSPWTGAIHPKNLGSLKQGQDVTKEWISSGPYQIRRWRPKEIVLVSRADYSSGVKGMAPEYFRVLKFQSAPVKNPSADFVQAMGDEPLVSDDHREYPTQHRLHVYWICRSHAEANSVCAETSARLALKNVLEGTKNRGLQGKQVRYRIPEGSDSFRAEIRKKISDRVTAAGGMAVEVSFLFKNATDADIELVFPSSHLEAPDSLASVWAQLSSRLSAKITLDHTVGLVASFPQSVQIKGEGKKREQNRDYLTRYQRVFLIPDPVPETLKF